MKPVKRLNHKTASCVLALTLLSGEPLMAQLASGAFRGASADLNATRQSAQGRSSTNGSLKSKPRPNQIPGLYGLLDIRHATNEYYDESGQMKRRDPAIHTKLRLGANFYNQALDVSFGVGAAKLPASQRVYQKRPDLMVDIYPYRGDLFNLLVYANAVFPVRTGDLDPTEFADGDRYDRDYRRAIDATVTAIGIAPKFKLDQAIPIGRATVTLGADAWTRMYSKPIYIRESDGSRDLQLVSDSSPQITEPFEDRAMRYVHQTTLAVGFVPAKLSSLSAEIAGYSESRYLPQYYYQESSKSWDYSYAPERISFTRFKLDLKVSDSTTVSNELYFFRNGFFAQDRIDQQRRFRNMIRLAIKL
jgi:hypothetical protein